MLRHGWSPRRLDHKKWLSSHAFHTLPLLGQKKGPKELFDPVVFLNCSVFMLHSILQTQCPQQILCWLDQYRIWSQTWLWSLIIFVSSHRLWIKLTWTVKALHSPLRNSLVLWHCLSSRLLIPSQQSTSMAQLFKPISLTSPGRAPRYSGCGILTFLEKLGFQHFAS